MTDIQAVFTTDSVLAAIAGDQAATGNSGSLEELIQAYVNAGLASVDAVQLFQMTFTDASFTLANLLVVPHNFGRTAAAVRVLDAVGERIYVDEDDSGINAIVLDFTPYRPFQGTGRIICV